MAAVRGARGQMMMGMEADGPGRGCFDFAGALGFVAINNEDTKWTATFKTTLPNASYCDVVGGKLLNGKCTGPTYVRLLRVLGVERGLTACRFHRFKISGGSFSVTVPARGAIAIHVGAKHA